MEKVVNGKLFVIARERFVRTKQSPTLHTVSWLPDAAHQITLGIPPKTDRDIALQKVLGKP